jgi:nucleotide-binding universal stress UspA family protein
MGYYEERPPRHGHRTPAELAEDEVLSALEGNVCAPSGGDETGPVCDTCSTTKHPKEWKPTVTTLTQTPAESRSAAAATGNRLLFRSGSSFKLLLAIENDDTAQAAIRLTDALTARGAIPTVVSVAEIMMPAPDTPNSMVFYAEAALGEDFHFQRRRSMQALISEAIGKDQDWPITSVVGNASVFIVDEAEAQNSGLIVLGIHHHGAFEQAIGENTATRVMGRASVPVMGVRSTFSGLPRRIMVATDFGDASREAAHVAANLADPGGTVILVHANIPSPIVEEGDEGAALVEREGIEHAFLHLSEEISAGKSIRVETVSRSGDAGTQLLAAAKRISPDLIAIASQRHNLVTRLLLGSNTRKLTREGVWPMLVTPPVKRA